MDDSDDEIPQPLPRAPDELREALVDIVVRAAQDDIITGARSVAVTHKAREQTAALRHKLFGEETPEIPFDPDEEREAQANQAAEKKKLDQSMLAALLSRGIGEA